MKRFIILLVSLAMLAQTASMAYAAPVGNPFLRGMDNPTELANVVESGLRRDPSGTRQLDPAQCRRNGSCASANDYLHTLWAYNSGLRARVPNVAALSAYLRSLKERDAPAGRYWMACLKATRGVYHPVTDCLVRSFHRGEKAWVDPVTGKVVFARDCTNLVGRPDAPRPPCYIVPFDYRGQRDIRWDAGRARVKAHLTISAEEYQRLQGDRCFFVHDEQGDRKPGPVECEDICAEGTEWPSPRLAAAVGIPERPPETSFEFSLEDGQGYISYPLWLLARVETSVYCVDVFPYFVQVKGFVGWRSVTRIDVVRSQEMVGTSSTGRLDRTLKGSIHY